METPAVSKPIDPGAEFSRPRENRLPFIIGFIERHPACTLPGGEAILLVQRIRELEAELGQFKKWYSLP